MPVSTLNASVSINGTPFETARATPSFSAEIIDTTPIGHTFRRGTPGFEQASVELEVFYDSSLHDFIRDNLHAGTIQTVVITWNTGQSVSGSAMVTDWRMEIGPNAVNLCTAQLTFINSVITHAG